LVAEVTLRTLFLIALVVPGIALGDSPLTSTDLHAAYADISQVALAKGMRADTVQFLVGDAPIDQKAAAINEIGWRLDGQAHARTFVAAVAQNRETTEDALGLDDFSASDLLVLGYLLAMDDYRTLRPLDPKGSGFWSMTPLALLDRASTLAPDDFTIQYVRGLVVGQSALRGAGDYCAVFRATQDVLDRFPLEKRNMRPAAVLDAQRYMDLYATDGCPLKPISEPTMARVEAHPDMNRIYRVDRLKDHIIAVGDGGVIAWDTPIVQPVAARGGSKCIDLVVHDGAAWAGCQGRVWRWDGATWSEPLTGDGFFRLLVGAEGELIAYTRHQAWARHDGRFQSRHEKIPGTDAAYLDGHLWWIGPRGIHGPHGVFAKQSGEYSGSQPRRMQVDSLGRLWVADFSNGMYRFNAQRRRFDRIPGPDDQVMGVAVDRLGEMTWIVHHSIGLYRMWGDELSLRLNLTGLIPAKDVHLDADGTLWLGSMSGLGRIRVDGDRVERVDFTITAGPDGSAEVSRSSP